MSGEGILLIVIIIAIIIAIVVCFYWFFFQKKGGKTGDPCTSQTDCFTGFYCGADDKCHLGFEGRSKGAMCSDSSQCDVGFPCEDGICGGKDQSNLIPSFQDSYITTMIDGKKRYLVVGNIDEQDTKSFWFADGPPNEIISWSQSTLFATVTTNDMSNDGNLTINSGGYISTGKETSFSFEKEDNDIFVKDTFGNKLSYLDKNTDATFVEALFFDPSVYDQASNLKVKAAMLTIEPISDSTESEECECDF